MSERTGSAAQGRDYQLPALLAEIADVVGVSAALAIAQVKGGTRTHIPASCPDDHWLVATVGREAADKISTHFRVNHTGGVAVVVPLGPTRLYDRARFEALALSDAGRSVSDIARGLGVSTRAVEMWKAAERKRKAIRRVGRPKADSAGLFKLNRAYAPVQDGLMRDLSGSEVPSDPPPSAAILGNAPELPFVDIGALPQILADIARVAGLGACVVIGRIKGGRVLHVTDHKGRGGELAALVGPASAEKLATFFAARHGGTIELLVPTVLPDVFLDVAAWCEAAREAGHTPADIAEWLGITPAVVDHLCTSISVPRPKGFNFSASFPYCTGTEED